MAITPTTSFNEIQTKRLHEILHREYTYAPERSSIARKITPADLIQTYATRLGDLLRGVFIKGGLLHYARTGEGDGLASDMDIEFAVTEYPNWGNIRNAIYGSVQSCIGPECNFFNREITWWSTHFLQPQGKFAIYGLPTQPHPIEITVKPWDTKDCCIGSGDAFRARIDQLLDKQLRIARAPLETVDDYDPEASWKLLENHQFTVIPLERIDRLINGLFHMCHLFSRSVYPSDPQIRQRFLDASFVLRNYPLKTYLEKHYPHDPEGAIIYLLNYVRVLNECKLEKGKKEELEQAIFEPVCSALGCAPTERYTPKEMRAFFLYAICYLYLRSSERLNLPDLQEGQVLFRTRRANLDLIGNDFIFTHLDLPTLHRLRNPEQRITDHPLLRRLVEKFPNPDASLADFFRRRATEEFPLQKPVIVETPPVPKPMLSSLIGKKSYKEIFQLCEQDPTLQLDALWLDAHPKEGLDFLLKGPLRFAKTHLIFCAKHYSRDQFLQLYHSLEPDLLALPIDAFLNLFNPFLEKFYPQDKKTIQAGLSRILQMDDSLFEQLGRHKKSLQLDKERLNKKPTPPPAQPPKAPPPPPPPPPPSDPIERDLARLPHDLGDIFETIFAKILILAATEPNEAVMGTIERVHKRFRSLWDRQDQPLNVKKQLYLFNIHLLTFYLSYRQGHPTEEAIQLLNSVLQSGFHKKVLTLEALKCPNLFADKMRINENEALIYREQIIYLEEVVNALWQFPEGRKALRPITQLIAVSLGKSFEQHTFFADLANKALAIENWQLIPEAHYYTEQCFLCLKTQNLKIPTLWKDTLNLTMQIALQIGKYRTQIPQAEFARWKGRGIELSRQIESAAAELPFAIRFTKQASPEGQLETLLGEIKTCTAHPETNSLEQALRALRTAVEHIEAHKLGSHASIDVLLAIWGVATSILIHRQIKASIPAQLLDEMEKVVFELAKRTRATLPTTLRISAREEASGEESDEKINSWLIDLLSKHKSIGRTPKEFFAFIEKGRRSL